MADREILNKVKAYVTEQFETNATHGIYFHNLARTCGVVKALRKIAERDKLHKKDITILEIAAWFHDLGYLTDYKNARQQSAKLARTFLEQEKVVELIIKRVTDLIVPTRLNHQPASNMEEILSDADYYYMSKPSFPAKNELLRKETEFLTGEKITLKVWYSETISLMESHHYLTPYGRTALTSNKNKNLEIIRATLAPGKELADVMVEHHHKGGVKEHAKAESGPEKGIETLFRIAASNNQRLFTLADNKAHILITVNSIIISIIVSVLIRKLAESPFLIWPTFSLLGASFASTVFSILATRPRIDAGIFAKEDLESKRVNLIYFGNFHRMLVDEYIEGMEMVMSDRTFLYQTLIRDAYWHGRVLGRKYGFLRKAYNVFLFGLGISIAAFMIAFLFHHQMPVTKSSLTTP